MQNNSEKDFLNIIKNVENQYSTPPNFDKKEHDTKARLTITKLFLWWYFCLIAGSFIFCLAYNAAAAYINYYLYAKQITNQIAYLQVSAIVSIITSTLGSGVGFVIGYYFKNKDDKE